MNGLIESHYLPSIEYFSAISTFPTITLEKCEHFVKQTYRNRSHILTSQGKQSLILPLTCKHGKVLITEVRVDYSQKWLNNHWRTIESAYRNAPFFEYYADDLEKVLFHKHIFLYDLNTAFLTICLKWLKSEIRIQESVVYEKIPSDWVFDLRNRIHPKKATFAFNSVTYAQVFGNKFVEPLSIIDLVFCEGPNARAIVAAKVVAQ